MDSNIGPAPGPVSEALHPPNDTGTSDSTIERQNNQEFFTINSSIGSRMMNGDGGDRYESPHRSREQRSPSGHNFQSRPPMETLDGSRRSSNAIIPEHAGIISGAGCLSCHGVTDSATSV
ncbi:hypothetical protein RSSM_02256 [Rhodopirellula sallentina SM41]|uniref:Uncharacterized protein n=1 Tax=Rhodopirellula sallentina SM41 TaxID=1263870 RepID=M5UJV8_9BACT|nr:hypothetical protein RSSM_02256 [Rhodopirellula sallentina SM41]